MLIKLHEMNTILFWVAIQIIQIIINVKNNIGFFFKVLSYKKSTIKLNIINLSKPKSLFCSGMPISIFSIKNNKSQNVGWEYISEGISYYKTKKIKGSNQFYTLSFTYYVNKEDIIYFAYSIPYTYSYLNEYLNSLLAQNNFLKWYSLDMHPSKFFVKD